MCLGLSNQFKTGVRIPQLWEIDKTCWGVGLQVKLGVGSQLALALLLSGLVSMFTWKFLHPSFHLASSKVGLCLFSIIFSLSDILSYRWKVPPPLLVEAEVISCFPSPQLQIHPYKGGELEHSLLSSPLHVPNTHIFSASHEAEGAAWRRWLCGPSLSNGTRAAERDLSEYSGRNYP